MDAQKGKPPVIPPQMARYAQILAGKHWKEVLGEEGLSHLQRAAAPSLLAPEAAPHNAWQVGYPLVSPWLQ